VPLLTLPRRARLTDPTALITMIITIITIAIINRLHNQHHLRAPHRAQRTAAPTPKIHSTAARSFTVLIGIKQGISVTTIAISTAERKGHCSPKGATTQHHD
jgi:hypothetical protein